MVPSPTACPDACSPAAKPVLPDEVLEDIFLLLDDAADLARASAACTCFRRVATAFRFLRRYTSLHPPPVLGLLDFSSSYRGFNQAQPPRRSAPAARAFAEAVDFNFSFLPSDPRCWRVRDFRDGRVLLARDTTTTVFFSEDLVVCDPLHRRYVQIPPIPGDLLAVVASTGRTGKEVFDPFLAPAHDEPSIQVICNVVSRSKSTVGTFIFASVTGKWRYATSFSIVNHEWMKFPLLLIRRYAHGCFYWMEHRSSSRPMLVLDIRAMKFSTVELPLPPPESEGLDKAIVEAGEGRLGLCILEPDDERRNFSLHSLTWRDDNATGEKRWHLDTIIPLPDYYWFIVAKAEAEGHILLRGFPRDPFIEPWRFPRNKLNAHYFTVDINTLLVERLCELKYESSPDYLYAGFPPPLSPPSI